jgi:hypothetical protein
MFLSELRARARDSFVTSHPMRRALALREIIVSDRYESCVPNNTSAVYIHEVGLKQCKAIANSSQAALPVSL